MLHALPVTCLTCTCYMPYLGKSHSCSSKEDLWSNWCIEVCSKFCSSWHFDKIIQRHHRATFSYCCSVWASCGARKQDVLQKLHYKATRIVTNSPFDAPAAPLLQRLGWPSAQNLTNKETGSTVYKSLNSLASQNLSDLFVRLSGVHPRELRNSKTDLAIPMLRIGNSQKSCAYRGASLSNSLDLDTKMAPSINAFKSKLKEK